MFRRISHPRLVQCRNHARRLLSSDEIRKSQAVADLRAFRNKTKTTKARNGTSDQPVNYRYRPGQENPLISTLWGTSSQEEKGEEDQVIAETKFVPFFDLVDEHMSLQHPDIVDLPSGQSSNIELLFGGSDRESDVPEQTASSKITGNDSVMDPRKSIMDAFQIKMGTIRQSAFQDEDFSQYKYLMEKMKSGGVLNGCRKPVSDWLLSNEKLIDYHLPLLSKCVHEGASTKDEFAFRDELAKQRTAFMKALNIDQEQYHKAVHCLVTIGRRCAKYGKTQAIRVAWEKVKEAGIAVTSDSLNTYLYVSSTFQNQSLSPNPLSSVMDLFGRQDKEMTNRNQSEGATLKKEVDVAEEVATFHDIMYPPSDQTISVRVKSIVSNGDGNAAEALLEQVSGIGRIARPSMQCRKTQ
jgi:hypothetical protein